MEETPDTHAAEIEPASVSPRLNATEARILGCLIEKAAITPDVYPLTLNALVAACNQKTSREPVMNLEPGAAGHALRQMETAGLVKQDPFAQRAQRYSHCFDAIYGVTTRQRAALCVMLLRGPQTLSELFTRGERLADFPSLDDVRDTVDRLCQRAPALVVRLPRGGGQREDRYMHLLSGPVDVQAFIEAASATASPSSESNLSARINRLEAEVALLKEQVAQLSQAHPIDG